MFQAISEPLDFTPTSALLTAAIGELDELGERGGGAVDAVTRRAALRAFLAGSRERSVRPSQWRHDYAALGFAGLEWSSGRLRVPALPRATPPAADATDDLP